MDAGFTLETGPRSERPPGIGKRVGSISPTTSPPSAALWPSGTPGCT